MKIRFRYVSSTGIISSLISFFTWSVFDHVEFELDGGWLGAQINGGVAIRPKDYLQFKIEEVMEVDLSDEQGATLLKWATSQIGKPYDLDAVLGFIVRRNWSSPSEWFCSEYVAAAFVRAGLPLINNTNLYRITPEMLHCSPIPKRVSITYH